MIITIADDSGSSLSFLDKPGSISGTIQFDFTISGFKPANV